MTRRERHERIIQNFGHFRYDRSVLWHLEGVLSARGVSALSDEATRDLAERLVRCRAHSNRINAENRRRRGAA